MNNKNNEKRLESMKNIIDICDKMIQPQIDVKFKQNMKPSIIKDQVSPIILMFLVFAQSNDLYRSFVILSTKDQLSVTLLIAKHTEEYIEKYKE